MSDNQIYNEQQLLERIRKGDEQSFASLFNAWRDKLYFFILRITNSTAAAEDVVQDVFTKLWVQRDKLDKVDNFNAWLYRVSQNHALNAIHRMAMETTILADLRRHAVESGQPSDDALLYKELQEKLQQAIGKLPPQQKLVYTLSRVEGLKQDQIAEQLQLSVSTVKNHMTEALRNIRQSLGGSFPLTSIYCLLFIELMNNQ